MTTDPLDRLLREASEGRADPETSRRAVRAALGLGVARKRRREARARVARMIVLTAVMMAAMFGQLGSDDFGITVEHRPDGVFAKNRAIYRQGLREEAVASNRQWEDGDLQEFFQQKATGEGVAVGVQGWELRGERYFLVFTERNINGKFIVSSSRSTEETPGVASRMKAFHLENEMANLRTLIEARDSREPDLIVPLRVDGLDWIVKGWRVPIAGYGVVTHFEGLRADGVRARGESPF